MQTSSSIGLYLGGKTQESIYRCCLIHGPVSMSELATLTNMKRSSLYSFVADLLRRGFLLAVPRGKRTHYDAAPPTLFLQKHDDHAELLQSSIIELEQLRFKQNILPEVSIVRIEGIHSLYEEIYSQVAHGKEVWFLTSIGDLEQNLPNVIHRYLETIKNAETIHVRELIAYDNPGKTYTRHLRMHHFSHPCRLLPRGLRIHNDLVLYEDTTVCVANSHRPWALVLKDKHIVATFRTLFESLWSQGKPR